MRTISFVERLELEFYDEVCDNQQQQALPWNLCQQAIALGDADNDDSNELAVGTVSGRLLIYKGHGHTAWRTSHDKLGMITCVTIGDVCNKKQNNVFVLSADGWCNIFHIPPSSPEEVQAPVLSNEIYSMHRQHLSPNSKLLKLVDIDSNGGIIIAVGFSDRVVRTYRWYQYLDGKGGELAILNKWALTAQIGSLSLKPTADNTSFELVVGQPGSTYVTLFQNGHIAYNGPESCKTHSETVSAEVVSNVHTGDGRSCFAMSTLDGSIMLMDYSGEIIYENSVDHQLFGLTKLDITGDGLEEAIVCSWDGETYIFNANKQIAKFQFDERTAAFIAGHYSVSSSNEPCLVYVTFSGRIYIYHNVMLAHVHTVSLIQEIDDSEKVKEFLRERNRTDCSREEKKKLYQWCLYGRKPKLCIE
ncbi:ITFG2 [Bugula neritina]|uniref:ITFG2 n=1 Tax=Bugula neritina TaxID=10212 RepID=A0A7J7K089_BUGNE|nr:ITFG2 [Bugula neritina]